MIATGSSWAADGFSVYAALGGAVATAHVVTPERVLDGLPDGDVRGARLRGVPGRRGVRGAGAGAGPAGHVPLAVRRRRAAARRDARGVRRCARGSPRPAWRRRRCRRRRGARRRARSCSSRSAAPTTRCTTRSIEDPGRRRGRLPRRRLRRARILADAIFDGHRLAREIDRPDDVALPGARRRIGRRRGRTQAATRDARPLPDIAPAGSAPRRPASLTSRSRRSGTPARWTRDETRDLARSVRATRTLTLPRAPRPARASAASARPAPAATARLPPSTGHRGAGHERRVVGQQERDGGGDLGRLRAALHHLQRR